MSFNPFKFEYVPPPTVPPTAPGAAPAPVREDDSASQEREPRAGKIIAQLDDLIATSEYLQTAIVTRFKDTAIDMGLNSDPDVGGALTRVYGVDTPPGSITIPMFNHLLDAEASAVQLEMALDDDAAVQTNPLQVADISLLTSRVEKHLISSGQYKYQLPVLLRSLKGDALVFNSWKNSLGEYPVMRHSLTPHQVIMDNLRRPGPIGGTIRATTHDLDRGLFGYMENYMNRYTGVYASMYSMMSDINHVERGIVHVIETFVLQPIADVTRVIGLFNGLKGLFHKDALQGIADAIGGFVFDRLAAETGQLTFMMDRFVNMAVSPLKNAVGRMGRLINSVNRAASAAGRAVDGLKGMSNTNVCGNHSPHNRGSDRYNHKPVEIPGLGKGDTLPTSLQVLGEHLAWATGESSRRRRIITDSFKKLGERRLHSQRNRLDVMCSLQSLDSLISLARGVVDESQRGTSFATVTRGQKIEAVGRILNTLQTGSGATFTVQDEEVIVNPPYMPAPPEAVERVLRSGGLDRITSSDILQVKGVL